MLSIPMSTRLPAIPQGENREIFSRGRQHGNLSGFLLNTRIRVRA
jgi:hypothetical protein